jgi:hypothetical protein
MRELAPRAAATAHEPEPPSSPDRTRDADWHPTSLGEAMARVIATPSSVSSSPDGPRSSRIQRAAASSVAVPGTEPEVGADERSATSRVQRANNVPAEPVTPIVVPRIQRATGAGDTDIIRRANAFYSDQPKAERKDTPLQTIKSNLAGDGISESQVVKHWQNDDNLEIAQTAKKSLTRPDMGSIERPVESSAWLDTPNQEQGSRKDPAWISAIGNLGTVEDQVLGETPKKYNGGHLIAWEFLNDAANVPGNIAPQADIQNQALFRRIERTLMEAITSGDAGGVELSVYTPYNHDEYTVTYRELFERKVLTDEDIRSSLETRDLLDKKLTFAQMAPDTYNTYFLTQTSSAEPVKSDAREQRLGIESKTLGDYSTETSDALIRQAGLGPLTILASNYDADEKKQVATPFAHIVYLNHRTHPPSESAPQGTLDDLPAARSDDADADALRALEWMETHIDLCVEVQLELQTKFGYSSAQAFDAIIGALMKN